MITEFLDKYIFNIDTDNFESRIHFIQIFLQGLLDYSLHFFPWGDGDLIKGFRSKNVLQYFIGYVFQ